jgi:zinc protease
MKLLFSKLLTFKSTIWCLVLFLAVSGLAYYIWSQQPAAFIPLDKTPFQSGYLIPAPKSADQGQVTAYLIIQSGEAEMNGPEGMLHYVEHLAWLSAIGKPSDNFQRHANAWTNSKSVGYWITSSQKDLKTSLATLAKIFTPISLDENFAVQERNIVEREYDLGVSNNPEAQLITEMDRVLYAGNGLSRSVIGKSSDIVQFDLKQAKAMHQRSHLAADAVLVVVGNVSAAEVYAALPEIEKSDLKPIVAPVFKMAEAATTHIDKLDAVVASKLIWRRIVPLGETAQYDAIVVKCNLLRDILTANLPGGLAKSLRYDQFVARELGFACLPIDDQHIEVQFLALPDKNVSLSNLLQSFEKSFAEIANAGISQETFDRVKTRYDQNWPKTEDEVAVHNWAKDHVIDLLSQQQTPSSLEDVLKHSNQLTLPAINALLKKIQSGGRTVISKLGKEIDEQ